jgi:tripartite-type tricarboxylate transporter receptor subunit TctC
MPNQESDLIIGLVAPARTAANVVTLLQKQIADILVLADVKSTLAKFSFQPVGSTSSAFASEIKNDIAVWGKVMQEAHIPRN